MDLSFVTSYECIFCFHTIALMFVDFYCYLLPIGAGIGIIGSSFINIHFELAYLYGIMVCSRLIFAPVIPFIRMSRMVY
jgi:hypothetical protein